MNNEQGHAHKHDYDESLSCRWCGHSIKLNGAWPSGTWLQVRLAEVRIKAALGVYDENCNQ